MRCVNYTRQIILLFLFLKESMNNNIYLKINLSFQFNEYFISYVYYGFGSAGLSIGFPGSGCEGGIITTPEP